MTVEEMEATLDRLGIEYVGSRGNEIQGFCPGHKDRVGHEDKNPSWYINSETGAHICFSCQFKGTLPYLVAYLKQMWSDDGLDFDAARKWLNEGGELSEAFERAVNKKKEVFEDIVYVSEASLAAFVEPPIEALRSRGLTASAAAKHQILWDARMENWIIPIRNPRSGVLLGWQEKGYRGRFFRNRPTGVQKSKALFGWNNYAGGDIIVVESPLDVVRLESVGISGGMATYGSLVSKEQLSLIKLADRVLIAMDADEAGQKSAAQIAEATQALGFEAWFFNYNGLDVKDIGAMSKAEIMTGIETARHSVRWSAWEVVESA
jgi:DNA primase